VNTTHIDIDTVEKNLGYVVAREPEAALVFDGEPDDIYDDTVRLVIQTARELVAQDQVATIENIASASGIAASKLRAWADACDRQMRTDWKSYAKLITLDAIRRRLQDLGKQLHTETSTMTNLFAVEQMLKDTQTKLMVMDSGRRNELLDVGEIIDVYAAKPEMRIAPIATPYFEMNRVFKGGLGRKRMWVFSGPQKRGKTTLMRNILLYMALNGHRVAHIAHDGGDKYDHALSYWAMLAHHYATKDKSIPCHAISKNIEEPIFLFTDEYMNAYAAGTLDFDTLRIDKRTIACIDKARVTLRELTSKSDTGGALMMIDASDVNGDLYELIRMLERILVTRGLGAFGLDHIGQLQNNRRNELEMMTENVRQIARFKNGRGVPCMIIAQQTREGTDGEASYSAKLRNLTTLEHECDGLMLVHGDHTMPDQTKVSVKFNRGGKAGMDIFLHRYEDSGLITEALR
jgi:hypothetical protein